MSWSFFFRLFIVSVNAVTEAVQYASVGSLFHTSLVVPEFSKVESQAKEGYIRKYFYNCSKKDNPSNIHYVSCPV